MYLFNWSIIDNVVPLITLPKVFIERLLEAVVKAAIIAVTRLEIFPTRFSLYTSAAIILILYFISLFILL